MVYTYPLMTIFVPAMPFSSREARSGEPALKYGPSVTSGVRFPDWFPPLQARADEPVVSVPPEVFGMIAFVPLLEEVVGATVFVLAQAERMIMQVTRNKLKIVVRFISSPFLKVRWNIEYRGLIFERYKKGVRFL